LIHAAHVDNSNISRATKLTDAERVDWLRLIRSDNVGPRGIMAQTPQESGR
jgi:DNA processing protein